MPESFACDDGTIKMMVIDYCKLNCAASLIQPQELYSWRIFFDKSWVQHRGANFQSCWKVSYISTGWGIGNHRPRETWISWQPAQRWRPWRCSIPSRNWVQQSLGSTNRWLPVSALAGFDKSIHVVSIISRSLRACYRNRCVFCATELFIESCAGF